MDNHSHRDACPLCGQNRRIRQCTCQYNWQFPFESIYSIFDFDETIKGITHHFKYMGLKQVAFDMGKTYAHCVPLAFFESMDVIAVVPLFFFRKMKRGYNQAEHFARGIAAGAIGQKFLFLPDVLVRKRPTKTQTKLSRKRRQTNVEGAFGIPPKKRDLVRNKNIILVDDIVTTAATTRECAKALLAAGAGKVRVLSLARD